MGLIVLCFTPNFPAGVKFFSISFVFVKEKMISQFISNFGIEDESQWPVNLLQELIPPKVAPEPPQENAENENENEIDNADE